MPSETYQLDPSPNPDPGIYVGQISADNALGQILTSQLSAVMFLGLDTKSFIATNAFMRFTFGHGASLDIPAGAFVKSATLQLLPIAAFSGDAYAIGCALAKDGKWDTPLDASFGWGSAPNQDMVLAVQNPGGGTTLVPQTHAAGVLTTPWTPRQAGTIFIVGDPVDRVGQCVTVVTGGTLGQVQATLGRIGSAAGSVFCEVYAATADDGSDDRPVGTTPLAISNALSFNSLSTGATGATATLVFSGANQITLVAGKRYVFSFRETTSFGGARMSVFYQAGNPYASGSLIVGLVPWSFSRVHYPERGSLPHLFLNDRVTPYAAPHGPTFEVNLPTFTNNVWADVPGFGPAVQAWVDDPAYVPGEPIGLHLAVSSNPLNDVAGVNRQWDDARLFVEWEVPAGSGSVVVSASAAQSSAAAAVVSVTGAAAAAMGAASALIEWVARATTTFVVGAVRGSGRALASVLSSARAGARASGRAEASPAAEGSARAGSRASGSGEVLPKVSGQGSIE